MAFSTFHKYITSYHPDLRVKRHQKDVCDCCVTLKVGSCRTMSYLFPVYIIIFYNIVILIRNYCQHSENPTYQKRTEQVLMKRSKTMGT